MIELDENGCAMPLCEECGAQWQVVRPGKWQPGCPHGLETQRHDGQRIVKEVYPGTPVMAEDIEARVFGSLRGGRVVGEMMVLHAPDCRCIPLSDVAGGAETHVWNERMGIMPRGWHERRG